MPFVAKIFAVWWARPARASKVPVWMNGKKQTYYGALNLYTKSFNSKYDQGTPTTITFLSNNVPSPPKPYCLNLGWSKLSLPLLKWNYLESVNQQVDESWNGRITCIRFNLMLPHKIPEDMCGCKQKRFIREFYHLCKSFFCQVKQLFELATHQQIFFNFQRYLCGVFS